ncbi:WcbI family polysaccharide biosynthesis putative acetyltransferase [Komagataeibacter rhaeticus]|nr:WcbI family polysaccharide biosynthesis putative acetyltransferase [Komagataeibacter rhaeticus]MBL7240766.1 hypothetical protein [Komagataeibacter rhaeticus]
MPQKWLVISNCQTYGLAHSLNLLCPDADVSGMDIWEFKNKIYDSKNIISNYDMVIASPEVKSIQNSNMDYAKRVETIPNILFHAYHPDLCYAHAGNDMVKTPLDAYNSIIAISAYNNGLTVEQAQKFYNRNVYQKAGYFDMWGPSVQALSNEFKGAGINIDQHIINWSRRSPFMYSINHPKINCLFDIAREFLRKNDFSSYEDSNFLPHDNLATGAGFPVYTEVAENYGVHGDYRFKIFGEYNLISLKNYLFESYNFYNNCTKNGHAIQVEDYAVSRYQVVSSLMTKG